MANIIDVDVNEIRNVANRVDNFISLVKSKKALLSTHVSELDAAWQGDDANIFKKDIRAIIDNNGKLDEMLVLLGKYRDYLNHCADKYKEYAERAVNRVSSVK